MKKTKHQGNFALFLVSQILLICLAVVVLYPIFFVFLTSVKSNMDILMNPFGIKTFQPQNYVDAWKIGKIGKYFMNSVITTVITLIIQIFVLVLASYALGKLKPWGHSALEILYLSGLFITTEMTTIPNYMTIKNWGLSGTRAALVLPYVTSGLAMASYIMTAYVRSLPTELDEAGDLDGASMWQNLTRITLPLMKPIITTVVIFNFQGVWSEFYWALIEIKKDTYKTLPLGLMNFQSQYNANYGVLTAGLTIAIVPVLLVYVFGSSYFIGGMTAGAVKG